MKFTHAQEQRLQREPFNAMAALLIMNCPNRVFKICFCIVEYLYFSWSSIAVYYSFRLIVLRDLVDIV